jgi:tRNA(Ile)-lysidine synthase TilS/MesJ
MPTEKSFGHEGFALCMQPLLPFEGDTIAIAVSGGSDSLALTLLTHHWATSHGFNTDSIL